MNIFCDTTVLVAASLQAHPHHTAAKAALERICRGDDAGFTSGHCLAEMFSVLSRMPTVPKLRPQDVLAILETNIIPHFTLLVLAPADYPQAIRDLAAKRLGGGRIYDLLHLTAARKQAVDRIYTFNDAEWKNLAPDLESVIAVPTATAATS
jgi:predicted nucleic acid-binding protein